MSVLTDQYASKAQIPSFDVEEIKALPITFGSNEDIFKYRVPKLTPDGTCSAGHDLEDQPYDLREILNISDSVRKNEIRSRIEHLYELIEGVQQVLKADWIGIYQVSQREDGTSVLVKLAYQGTPSRAEFPLTEQFAQLSNNSTVGLSGKAIVIESVENFDGPYYECDANVKSEACLPIFDSEFEKVIGIVDAESFEDGYFNDEKVAIVAKLCQQLSQYLPIR